MAMGQKMGKPQNGLITLVKDFFFEKKKNLRFLLVVF